MNLQKITERTITLNNKQFPECLTNEAKMALSFYPELLTVPIEFRLTKKMGDSVMKAQPKFWSLFKNHKKREYVVLISRHFGIKNKELNITQVPKEVMTGWLGHELGHIMDYKYRSTLNLIAFGIKYLWSESFVKRAEQTADRFAITHNMEAYILATKNFILNHTELSTKYKEKIKRLYASPEDILDFVNEETT